MENTETIHCPTFSGINSPLYIIFGCRRHHLLKRIIFLIRYGHTRVKAGGTCTGGNSEVLKSVKTRGNGPKSVKAGGS